MPSLRMATGAVAPRGPKHQPITQEFQDEMAREFGPRHRNLPRNLPPAGSLRPHRTPIAFWRGFEYAAVQRKLGGVDMLRLQRRSGQEANVMLSEPIRAYEIRILPPSLVEGKVAQRRTGRGRTTWAPFRAHSAAYMSKIKGSSSSYSI